MFRRSVQSMVILHFFTRKKCPQKRSSRWAARGKMIKEMDSTRKSRKKPYATCQKHSTHRWERARQSIAILTLRGIWRILGRKSRIWVILTALVRRDEKINSWTVFSKVKTKGRGTYCTRIWPLLTVFPSLVLLPELGEIKVSENTYFSQISCFERIIQNNTSDSERHPD